jgi:hypothetical protein
MFRATPHYFRGDRFNKSRPAMDRLHIYQTKTLVGVEFAREPARLPRFSQEQHAFVRLAVPEVKKIVGQLIEANPDQQFSAELRDLMQIAGARLMYWENKVPPGSKCFVHHIRFDDSAAGRASIAEIRAKFSNFALLGLYQINPMVSFSPRHSPSILRRACGSRV